MAEVSLLSPGVFPGWDAIHAKLAELPPAETAVILARCVHASASQSDGRFVQNGAHTAVNHHLLQRLLLRAWANLGWTAPTPSEFARVLEAEDAIRDVLKALIGRRQEHPAFTTSLVVPQWMKTGQVLWFSALEQRFLNRVPRHELARTWLLFSDVWPSLETTGAVSVPAPAQTAFDAIENALMMAVLLWKNEGYVADVAAATADTALPANQLPLVTSLFATDASQFLADLPSEHDYPLRGFANPFAVAPVLSFGDGEALFAPQPDTIFTGFEYRTLTRALTANMEGADDKQKGFDDTAKAFGKVMERYVQRLLQGWCDGDATDRFVDEYTYELVGNQEVASPDAFVLDGAVPLVFEVKALRYPFDVDNSTQLADLASWMAKLAGETTTRAPFEQGVSYFTALSSGDAATTSIGTSDLDDALYLIVSYDHVPAVANWPRFRSKLWATGLSPNARALLDRTLFIGLPDLENALGILQMPNEEFPNLGAAVSAWFDYLQIEPVAWSDETGRGWKSGLTDYLIARIDGAANAPSVPFLRDALEQLFERATELGFA